MTRTWFAAVVTMLLLGVSGERPAQAAGGRASVDETFDVVSAAPDDAEHAVRFRRGWFLGDGTGAGKGRHVRKGFRGCARSWIGWAPTPTV